MKNPKITHQPNTYGGMYWNTGDIIHTNTGVMNYWFYLLKNGGSGTNDKGYSYNIQPMASVTSRITAEELLFNAINFYFTSTTNFSQACMYTYYAVPMFSLGSDNLTIRSYIEEAWRAVGVSRSTASYSSNYDSNFKVNQMNLYCVQPESKLIYLKETELKKNISVKNNRIVAYSLYNTVGVTMKAGKIYSLGEPLNFSDQSSGFYLLRLRFENNTTETHKIYLK